MISFALKGHNTRGNDVLKILKMLGGIENGYNCCGDKYYYYINAFGFITGTCDLNSDDCKIFTLEEFEKKYPYFKGDIVVLKATGELKIVKYVSWCEKRSDIVYTLVSNTSSTNECEVLSKDICFCGFNDDNAIIKTHVLNDECVELIYNKKTHEIITDENGRTFLNKKKIIYPCTYKDCCKILGDLSPQFPSIRTHNVVYDVLFTDFYKLILCRNAYWKLFDDWKPNFKDGTMKFTIECHADMIIDCGNDTTQNVILVFPTKEMRDAFYENFEVLIEKCKIFL